jgi:alpha-L-glutamate ligase-like protein
MGILSINQRNAEFVLPQNPRRNYPRVDDKLLTKRLAVAAGLPVPRLLGSVSYEHELRNLPALLDGLEEFVLKPARGSQGNGIVVVTGVENGRYRKSMGKTLKYEQLRRHVSSTIAGVFSLRGDVDACLIEARVTTHPSFEPLTWFGIPDIRVIVYRGVPVMAMCRLPTSSSDGRANLHQGAIAAALDLATGRVLAATHRNQFVTQHVDTKAPLVGFVIPQWDDVLSLAARASEMSGLGYLGVDVVVDAAQGPLLLELNARPGLAIQVAHGEGLLPRLRAVEALGETMAMTWAERCAIARDTFARPCG